MDEVQAIERVLGVLDAAVHVHTTFLAGVALNGRLRIDDLELLRMFSHFEPLARRHSDDGEHSPFGLPTLRTATGVVVSRLRADADLDLIFRAFAEQRASGEVGCGRLDASIDGRMDLDGHVSLSSVTRTPRRCGSTCPRASSRMLR